MALGKQKKGLANLTALLLFSSVSLEVGCGSQNLSAPSNLTGSSSAGSGGATNANIWAGVPTQGVASGPLFNGVLMFNIDTVNNIINIRIPIGVDLGSVTGTFPI